MKLTSAISAASEQFKLNESANLEALGLCKEAARLASLGGGDGPRARHVGRGKMRPRDRGAGILDPGSS